MTLDLTSTDLLSLMTLDLTSTNLSLMTLDLTSTDLLSLMTLDLTSWSCSLMETISSQSPRCVSCCFCQRWYSPLQMPCSARRSACQCGPEDCRRGGGETQGSKDCGSRSPSRAVGRAESRSEQGIKNDVRKSHHGVILAPLRDFGGSRGPRGQHPEVCGGSRVQGVWVKEPGPQGCGVHRPQEVLKGCGCRGSEGTRIQGLHEVQVEEPKGYRFKGPQGVWVEGLQARQGDDLERAQFHGPPGAQTQEASRAAISQKGPAQRNGHSTTGGVG